MAIAIRIKSSEKEEKRERTKSKVKDSISNHNEVLKEQNSPISKVEPDELTERPAHMRAVHRFKDSDSKSQIIQDLKEKMEGEAKWYKIESHDCDHDRPGNKRTGCGEWKTEEENGKIPEGV